MSEAVREMTFDEEYEILQAEKNELFAEEDEHAEPPFANCVVRRALRCIRKLKEEREQYKAIGTVSEFQQLKEKATAKKVDVKEWIYTKCDCGYEFSTHHGDGYYSIPYERQTNYCPNCGQRLLWD